MPVTSPHAIYGTEGDSQECNASAVWLSAQILYIDATKGKGKKQQYC